MFIVYVRSGKTVANHIYFITLMKIYFYIYSYNKIMICLCNYVQFI